MTRLLTLSFLLLGACAPVSTDDCERTCDGCCREGVCFAGNEQSACGAPGLACDTCIASQRCVLGRCVFAEPTDAGSTGGGGGAGGGGGSACLPESDPQLCARAAKECGALTAADNCGTVRSVSSCGTCLSAGSCSDGQCVCVAESNAAFCARAGRECGSSGGVDNCGTARTVFCGACSSPDTCDASGQCSCVPESDAQLCTRRGRACGPLTAADNCGTTRTLASCGSCLGSNTCDGAGVCACPETSLAFCQRLQTSCGPVSGTDSCGNPKSVASCGSCSGFDTCGGGSTAGACGCTPQTDAELCQAQSVSCGALTVTDRCGVARTVSCGTCGTGTRCPAGNGPNRSCQAFTCGAGQRACGATCATCPTANVTATACGPQDTCVATACATDFALVGGVCQPATCPGTDRSCGGICRSCPTTGVATTICSGPACIAATCQDGSGLVGGACTAMTCSAGSLYCTAACATCPTAGALTYGCNGTQCGARSCAAGFTLLGDRCIDSDWTYEVLDTAVDRLSGPPRSAALAFGPAGSLVAAYVQSPGIVIARRNASGQWGKLTLTLGQPGLTAVTNLAVDSAGNAHLLYYTYVTVNGTSTAYRYVKVSPTGTMTLPLEVGVVRRSSTGTLSEQDGVGLAVDGAGDAHLTYIAYDRGPYPLYYRRSYAGAWLAPVWVSDGSFRYPAIKVSWSGDVVQLAGGYFDLIRAIVGTNSVFGPSHTSPFATGILQDLQLYDNAGNLEVWARNPSSYWCTTLTASGFLQPVAWFTNPGTPRTITGARGPTGFSVLESDSSDLVTARRGSATGPTLTEATNLLLSLSAGSLLDTNGTMHALAWLTGSNTNSRTLVYVHGH